MKYLPSAFPFHLVDLPISFTPLFAFLSFLFYKRTMVILRLLFCGAYYQLLFILGLCIFILLFIYLFLLHTDMHYIHFYIYKQQYNWLQNNINRCQAVSFCELDMYARALKPSHFRTQSYTIIQFYTGQSCFVLILKHTTYCGFHT